MICDREGVPALVQRFEYRYGDFTFKATLFTGGTAVLDAGYLCPSLDLCAKTPTRMQFLEALNRATELLGDPAVFTKFSRDFYTPRVSA